MRRIPTRVPNFPILKERSLLLILRLKLPGNVAHGDHTQHVHSACPHTMVSVPAHRGPAETPFFFGSDALVGLTPWVN